MFLCRNIKKTNVSHKTIKENHIHCKVKLIFKKINLSNSDSKSTWKILNHVIKPDGKFSTIKLVADDIVLTDHTETASVFNEYFSHVTDELMNNIPPTTISPLANMSRLYNTFTYFETDSQEVSKLIK